MLTTYRDETGAVKVRDPLGVVRDATTMEALLFRMQENPLRSLAIGVAIMLGAPLLLGRRSR